MTEMLQSIKSDLLSRRLLPVLVLLAVALVAAVGYALSGGSGAAPESSTSGASASTPSEAKALRVVVASTSSNEALAETPGGARYQSTSPTRNPFTPLPSPPQANAAGSKAAASSTAKSSGSGSSSAGSSSGGASSGGSSSGGSGASGGSAPAPAPKQSKPKPQSVSTVSVLFGLAPTTPGQAPALTTYSNVEPQAELPSKQNAHVAFERVSASGKGAIFKFVLAPIMHGQGRCVPSTSECEALELAVGQTEELEYDVADGQTAVYQLKVVAITVNGEGASAARVARAAARVRRAAASAEHAQATHATFDTVGPTSPGDSK